MNTEQLIRRLLDPASYPHPVEVITIIETHISVVFLTGEYVYKLKKPVNFGFLDFSQLQQRHKYCKLEVELNRRTAPDLYLGVCQVVSQEKESGKKADDNSEASIRVQPHDYQLSDKTEQCIDYLVKMQQFDPNDVLGKKLKGQTHLSFSIVEKLAYQISSFHKIAEIVQLDCELGEPKTQLQPMLDNFPTLFKNFADPEIQTQLEYLLNWTENQFEQLESIITERKKNGYVRACHGDLHLENITLINGEPVLFDGIEFNEKFRWIDVLSDLSFLLIDMDFRNQQAASYQILSLYLSTTLDYKALKLLSFYKTYRTLVRAKINSLRSEQLTPGSVDYQRACETSRAYIHQASQYASMPTSKPKCILLQGVSGSGKSHLAKHLLYELELKAIIISSDRIRKSLFGIESTVRLAEEQRKQLYSSEMSRKTYAGMLEYAETALNAGLDVIVDATFLKKSHRTPFTEMADSLGAQSYLIHIEVSTELAEASIEQRQKRDTNPSDADATVMHHQCQQIEKPLPSEDALTLSANDLRHHFPKKAFKNYLDLPITKL